LYIFARINPYGGGQEGWGTGGAGPDKCVSVWTSFKIHISGIFFDGLGGGEAGEGVAPPALTPSGTWLVRQSPRDSITVARLEAIFPDSHDHMKEFRDNDTAADVSWFLHDRPDRIIFSAMWACLFGEAEDKLFTKSQCARLLEYIEDGSFASTVRRLKADWQVAPHPSNVFRELLTDG